MNDSRSRILVRAAVEAAVIIVGVMLALIADRWVMGLDERAQEADIVERLLEDLQADSVSIATAIQGTRTRQDFAIRLLYEQSSTAIEDPAAHVAQFERVAWSASLEFARGTWDDLLATGRSSLIRAPETRQALSRYYDQTDRVSWLDTGWNEVFLRYQDRAKGVLPVQVRLSALGIPLPEPFVPVEVTADHVATLQRSLILDEELRADLGQVVVVYQGKATFYPTLLAQLSDLLTLLRGAL